MGVGVGVGAGVGAGVTQAVRRMQSVKIGNRE
jgi:hypothetical protein